jgi:hypothetical protein
VLHLRLIATIHELSRRRSRRHRTPDTQGPVTSNVKSEPTPALLNGLVTITGDVSDETTGNHRVASSEYRIDDGAWDPMGAEDKSFDSSMEAVEKSVVADRVGTHKVCVRGTDEVGNTGAALCQAYLVTYKFTGFLQPLENEGAVNTVKAGQAIPIKWRLTDANDVPIADPSSFAGLQAYAVSCTDFLGDPLEAVDEAAAGSSGLQYMGDGYWQFNWKTPTDYADTCRAMMVKFDSGAMSPAGKFEFR